MMHASQRLERAGPGLTLAGRDVHVWPMHLDADSVVAQYCESVLAPNEAARGASFRFDSLRRAFVLSRGLLRILLGAYLNVRPGSTVLGYGPKGKPSLSAPERLRFNVAHSATLALFAFTLDCEVGIDVEQLRPLPNMLDIAQRFFCEEEAAELMSLPANDRAQAFFLCWTRKEAYVKAVGDGLSAPLDSFRVSLLPGASPRILHLLHNELAAEGWTLHNLEFDPPAAYAAALAYHDTPRPVRVMQPMRPAELLELLSSMVAPEWGAESGEGLSSVYGGPTGQARAHDS